LKDKQTLRSTSNLQISLEVESRKRKLYLTLAGSALLCTVLTIFAPISGNRDFYSDVIAVITSGSAFVLSIQVIYRQKLKGLFPRLYASLGLGVGLWFIAESIWAYYEIVAGIETPFPSLADAFWLAGYVPVVYFLFSMLKNFLGASKKSVYVPLVIISSIGLILLVNILLSIYQQADLTTNDGLRVYLVSSAYPVADMFLIIPAITAFIQLRKGMLTFTPWAYLVMAPVLFIVGDIGFAYFTAIGDMDDMLWIWNPFYYAAYLAIACSLFWHREFFTIDERKLTRAWQKKNR
jgi:hypothetical protein